MKKTGRKSKNIIDVRDIKNSGSLRLKADPLPSKYNKIGDTSLSSMRKKEKMVNAGKDMMKQMKKTKRMK